MLGWNRHGSGWNPVVREGPVARSIALAGPTTAAPGGGGGGGGVGLRALTINLLANVRPAIVDARGFSGGRIAFFTSDGTVQGNQAGLTVGPVRGATSA